MRSDRIMTPEHPRWMEFLSQLSRVPICRGTNSHARSVLAALPEIDVEESLRVLASLGGTCDCKIELDLGNPAARFGS